MKVKGGGIGLGDGGIGAADTGTFVSGGSSNLLTTGGSTWPVLSGAEGLTTGAGVSARGVPALGWQD